MLSKSELVFLSIFFIIISFNWAQDVLPEVSNELPNETPKKICPSNCTCTPMNTTFSCPPGYSFDSFWYQCIHQCPTLDYYTVYKHHLACDAGFTYRNKTCVKFTKNMEIICQPKTIKCCTIEFPKKCDAYSGVCYQRSYQVHGPLCDKNNGTLTEADVQNEIQSRYQFICSGGNTVTWSQGNYFWG